MHMTQLKANMSFSQLGALISLMIIFTSPPINASFKSCYQIHTIIFISLKNITPYI